MGNSSENFDFIIRAKDEASATIEQVKQRTQGLGTAFSDVGATADRMPLKRVATDAILMSGALDSLGDSGRTASSVLSGLALGFGPIGIALAAGTVAFGLITKAIKAKVDALHEATAALDQNLKSLNAVIAANQNFDPAVVAHSELVKEQKRLAQETARENELAAVAKANEFMSWRRISPELATGLSVLKYWTEEIEKQNVAAANAEAAMKRYADQVKAGRVWDKGLDEAMMRRESVWQKRTFDPMERGIDQNVMRQDSAWLKAMKDQGKAVRDVIEGVSDDQRRLNDLVRSGMVDLGSGIINTFFGVQQNLAEIWKRMALDFEQYFLSKLFNKLAGNIAESIFNAIFPGSGAAVSAIGDFVGGGGSMGKVSPAAAMPGGSPRVAIYVSGNLIGEEEHIKSKVVPVIERLSALNATTIVTR